MTGVRLRHVRLARDEAPAVDVAAGSSIVFPRLPVRVRHGDHRFIADSTIAVLYVWPEPFARECLDSRGVASDWIELPRDVVDEAVGRLGATRTSPFVLPCAMPALLLERLMCDEIESNDDPLWLDEAALLLLDRLIAQPVRPLSGYARLADDAKAIIARDPAAATSLPQLAATLGVSPFHLCRVFTAWAGISLSTYRDQLRIRIALDELARGDLPTSVVAQRLGYTNPRVFCRRFRQLTGLTIDVARRRTTDGKGLAIRTAVFAPAGRDFRPVRSR